MLGLWQGVHGAAPAAVNVRGRGFISAGPDTSIDPIPLGGEEGWGRWAVGRCMEGWGLCGVLRKFVLVVCGGPPTQHMGLPAWELHCHGNLQATGSALYAENCGALLPGEGQKKLPPGVLLLRGPLPLQPGRASGNGGWHLHTRERLGHMEGKTQGLPSPL